MIWEDILLPHRVRAMDLARAFGAALRLDPATIVVVDDAVEALDRVTPGTPLLLQRDPVEGDLRQHVAAFPRLPELAASDEWSVLRAICERLQETCLVPDEEPGETYLAVRPDGAVDRVLLEEGDDGQLRIVQQWSPVRAPISA